MNSNIEFNSEEDGLSTYDLTLIASRIYSELTPVSEIDYFEDYDKKIAA
tara:strand:- start:539 stop:685 length:147 start_codon:yes stop_codon:yes gene_type:complete